MSGGQYDLPPGASEEQPGEDQRARLVQRKTGETEACQWRQHSQFTQLCRTSALEIFQCSPGLETRGRELLLRSDQQGELQVSVESVEMIEHSLVV